MSEQQIVQALAHHEQAARAYLLERNRWNGERLYRRCNEEYFRLQSLWHTLRMPLTASAALSDAYETALYLQTTVEQEHAGS